MVRWIGSGRSVRSSACGHVRSVVRRGRCGNDTVLTEVDVRPCLGHPTLMPVQAGASLAGKLSSEASSTLSYAGARTFLGARDTTGSCLSSPRSTRGGSARSAPGSGEAAS